MQWIILTSYFIIFANVFFGCIHRGGIAGSFLLFLIFLIYSKCFWMWFSTCCVYSVVVEYGLTLKSSWLQRTFKLGPLCDVFYWWIIIFDIFWWPDNQGEKYWDFHFKHLMMVSLIFYQLRNWWALLGGSKTKTAGFTFILEKCWYMDYSSHIHSVHVHWVLPWPRCWKNPVIKLYFG